MPRFLLGISLKTDGPSASENIFVKFEKNFDSANSPSVIWNRNCLRNNAMSLARLLKSCLSSTRRVLVSNSESFRKETAIMTNLETFEYSPEMETSAWGGETESEVFGEAETMELAGEMLGIANEAELDRFLGDLIKKAGSALGKVVSSPIGQAVGGWLKGAAKSALPLAGGALGGFVGGPLGARIGSGLGSLAGGALGLEAELSQEDREFEGAKNFVKMAADAVKSAVAAPPGVNPVEAAKAAVRSAVEKHAPGLLGGVAARGQVGGAAGSARKVGRTGRWVRQGRNVVIVNCG
jgi:hypothetical protein